MIAVCGQGDDMLVLEHQMALAVRGDAVEPFIGCYPDIVFEIFQHLELVVAYQFAISDGIVCSMEFSVAIGQVSGSEIS